MPGVGEEDPDTKEPCCYPEYRSHNGQCPEYLLLGSQHVSERVEPVGDDVGDDVYHRVRHRRHPYRVELGVQACGVDRGEIREKVQERIHVHESVRHLLDL